MAAKGSQASSLVSSGKEYTQADSRYATRDSFVISMEAVTAFVEGPACFLAVYGILARRPWAYTVQIMVSLGQIYGDVLYFATTVLEGALTTALQCCVCDHCCPRAVAGCCSLCNTCSMQAGVASESQKSEADVTAACCRTCTLQT
jgi:EXPERA (EXPanded EBP superfamily)